MVNPQREGYLLSEIVQQSLHVLQALTIGNEETVLLRHVRDVARSEERGEGERVE